MIKYIIFAPSNKCDNSNIVIYLKNEVIKEVTKHKFHGEWFNLALNWNSYVQMFYL